MKASEIDKIFDENQEDVLVIFLVTNFYLVIPKLI